MNRKWFLAILMVIIMAFLSSCNWITHHVIVTTTSIYDSIHGVYTSNDPDHILVEEYDVD